MNWGNRILLVFAVFGGGISFMVWKCMQIPVDLVSKEYYRDEIAYQQVIDGSRHANALSSKINLYQADGKVCLEFPREMKGMEVQGTILFYCTADLKKDRQFRLAMDTAGKLEIEARELAPAHYTAKVQWKSGGVGYYSEQPIEIH